MFGQDSMGTIHDQYFSQVFKFWNVLKLFGCDAYILYQKCNNNSQSRMLCLAKYYQKMQPKLPNPTPPPFTHPTTCRWRSRWDTVAFSRIVPWRCRTARYVCPRWVEGRMTWLWVCPNWRGPDLCWNSHLDLMIMRYIFEILDMKKQKRNKEHGRRKEGFLWLWILYSFSPPFFGGKKWWQQQCQQQNGICMRIVAMIRTGEWFL